jgi:sialic acid synthase SpsE
MKHTLVIAEAGVNHNGDLQLAFQLVEAAAQAGADVVKFQTFQAQELATGKADKAVYQKKTT